MAAEEEAAISKIIRHLGPIELTLASILCYNSNDSQFCECDHDFPYLTITYKFLMNDLQST